MPRDIPLGNGRLLVAFDDAYRIRDLYYPHVGLENHVMGRKCRLGVQAGGAFSWVGSPSWKVDLLYEEDALVSDVHLRDDALGVAIRVNDAVDCERPVLLRRFRVANLRTEARRVRVYFHHDLDIMETDAGDTAHFDPRLRGVIHYKRRRYFLLNLMIGGRHGVAEYSAQKKRQFDDAGARAPGDAHGVLDQNAIAHGAVDSIVAVTMDLAASSEQEFWFWLIAGTRYQDVAAEQAKVLERGPEARLDRARAVSRASVRRGPPLDALAPEDASLVRNSLLVIHTQCDQDGGILAANDTDIMRFARDTYSYVWPRDGALVARALDVAGHHEHARRFFQFCVEHVSQGGYFFQKYNADGSLASSWHPWIKDGKEQIPIQEDETALVLWALGAHVARDPDMGFLVPSYSRFVRRAADFIYDFRDAETGLPHPSWDLWEERFGVHAFTVASVVAGLRAAAAMSAQVGDDHAAARYRGGADEVQAALERYLYHEDLGRFVRMGHRENGGYWHDVTIDAALAGLFLLDVLPLDDERLVRTINAIEKRLWVKTPIGGCARYENDYYHQVSNDLEKIPGNPWFVCTLWLAEWHARRAASAAELEPALRYLEWARLRARPSGIMAEQVHPEDGAPVSVAPLTWSHAAYVSAAHAVAAAKSRIRPVS